MTHVARSTLIVAVFFGLEKLLGFLRQVLIARTFGLSPELDAFNTANNLPDLIFALISGGALAVAFIPVLSEYLEKRGRPQAWELFSRIANLVFLVTAGLSLVIALFADQLVRWQLGIAPGFGAQQQALVAELMRLNLLATLLFSLGGLAIAGLQANQHFLLPALAPSMYDLGTLFGVLVLAPDKDLRLGSLHLPALNLGVHGLVYGVILGAALFLLVQVPGLLRYGFRWVPHIGLRHPGVLQVLSLLGPRLLTVLCIQLTFIAQDNIASRLAIGTVSALVYGWLFMQVPETIIGTALGTALLPTLSEQAALEQTEAFRQSLNRALRALLTLTLPAAALIAAGIQPVVSLLGFDETGVELVTWTARAFLLGLMGHSLLEVSVRAFYARQDALTPLLAAALTLLAFILLALTLGRSLGAPGIGLANALAFSGEALFLWALLSRRFRGMIQLGKTPWRALLAAIVSGLTTLLLLRLADSTLGGAGMLLQSASAVLAMGLGAAMTLPLIGNELKLLIRL